MHPQDYQHLFAGGPKPLVSFLSGGNGTEICLISYSENPFLRTLSWGRTRRNPLLLFVLSGSLLLRFDTRQFLALLFQLPPRSTRFEHPISDHFFIHCLLSTCLFFWLLFFAALAPHDCAWRLVPRSPAATVPRQRSSLRPSNRRFTGEGRGGTRCRRSCGRG